MCQAPFLAPALSSAGPRQTQRCLWSSPLTSPIWRCPSGGDTSSTVRCGRLLEGAALQTCPFHHLLWGFDFLPLNMAGSCGECISEDGKSGKDPRYAEKIPPQTRKDFT